MNKIKKAPCLLEIHNENSADEIISGTCFKIIQLGGGEVARGKMKQKWP